MKEEIEQLKREITELKTKVSFLENYATIPYPVEQAFKQRLGIPSFVSFSTSTKSATSEAQTVDEAGSASYIVLKNPDGWEERVVNNVVRYYPYWL